MKLGGDGLYEQRTKYATSWLHNTNYFKGGNKMDALNLVKYCGKCKLIKMKDEFHRNKSNEDGRAVYCAKCMNGYAKKPKQHSRFMKPYSKKENEFILANSSLTAKKLARKLHRTEDGVQYQRHYILGINKIKKALNLKGKLKEAVSTDSQQINGKVRFYFDHKIVSMSDKKDHRVWSWKEIEILTQGLKKIEECKGFGLKQGKFEI